MGGAPSVPTSKLTDLSSSPRGYEPVVSAESLSFEIQDNAVIEAYSASRSLRHFKLTATLRWVVIIAIGCGTAIVATAITVATVQLNNVKQNVVNTLIDAEGRKDGTPWGTTLCAYSGISVAYAAAAAIMVAFIEPAAGGSGIPEIKAMLNGVALPQVLRVRALFVKALGNALSVASGLPVGKEGPMVHSGAILASAMSQGSNFVCGRNSRWLVHEPFRNDREKRDFVSCGAAAGVAAAFGAPVGGLLFAIEEGTSHWFRSLVWRILLCSIVAAFVVNLLLSGLVRGVGWGALDSPGMLAFGEFQGSAWALYELPLFLALGAVGGFIGAAFNATSRRITAVRRTYVPSTSRTLRVFEVVILTAVTSAAKFCISVAVGKCAATPTPTTSSNNVKESDAFVRLYCPAGQYNDVASLLMAPAEATIKRLFHSSVASGAVDEFPLVHLIIFLCYYASSAAITFGVAVPSGLFIPALLSGASLGRIVGSIARTVAPVDSLVDPGVYALIGSAAMLGGTTRMTVSLAVILLECTGNLSYALPLMLTLMSARMTGNWFNEGIYDTHINIAGWPVLGETPSGLDAAGARELRVADIMTPARKLRTLQQVCTVRDATALLLSCRHHAFPVVYSAEMLAAHPRLGNLAGLVARRHVATLIARRAFHALPPALPLHAVAANAAAAAAAAFARDGQTSPLLRGGAGVGPGGLLSDVAFTLALDSAASATGGTPVHGENSTRGYSAGSAKQPSREGVATLAARSAGRGDVSPSPALASSKLAGRDRGRKSSSSSSSSASSRSPSAAASRSAETSTAATGPRAGPSSKAQGDLTFVVVLDGHNPPQPSSYQEQSAGSGTRGVEVVVGSAVTSGAGAFPSPSRLQAARAASAVGAASPSRVGVSAAIGRSPSATPTHHAQQQQRALSPSPSGRAVMLRLPSVPSYHSPSAAAPTAMASRHLTNGDLVEHDDAALAADRGADRRVGGGGGSYDPPLPVLPREVRGPIGAGAAAAAAAFAINERVGSVSPGALGAAVPRRRASDAASRLRYGSSAGGDDPRDDNVDADTRLGLGARPAATATASGSILAAMPWSNAITAAAKAISRGSRSDSTERAPLLERSPAPPRAREAVELDGFAGQLRGVAAGSGGAAALVRVDNSGGSGAARFVANTLRRAHSVAVSGNAATAAATAPVTLPLTEAASRRRRRQQRGGSVASRGRTAFESGNATTTTDATGRSGRSHGGGAASGAVELLYDNEPLLDHEDLEASYPHTPLVGVPTFGTSPADLKSEALASWKRSGYLGAGHRGTSPSAASMPLVGSQRRSLHQQQQLSDVEGFLDLRPYLNPAPYTVHVHAPLDRAYDLFRSLGLRHLPVVNDAHDVIGIVTRWDLTGERLAEALLRKRRRLMRVRAAAASAAQSC